MLFTLSFPLPSTTVHEFSIARKGSPSSQVIGQHQARNAKPGKHYRYAPKQYCIFPQAERQG